MKKESKETTIFFLKNPQKFFFHFFCIVATDINLAKTGFFFCNSNKKYLNGIFFSEREQIFQLNLLFLLSIFNGVIIVLIKLIIKKYNLSMKKYIYSFII